MIVEIINYYALDEFVQKLKKDDITISNDQLIELRVNDHIDIHLSNGMILSKCKDGNAVILAVCKKNNIAGILENGICKNIHRILYEYCERYAVEKKIIPIEQQLKDDRLNYLDNIYVLFGSIKSNESFNRLIELLNL